MPSFPVPPRCTYSWLPNQQHGVPADLDIYVGFDRFHYLNPESFSLIRSVTTFGKASGQINVIVSKTSSIAPILQFHSTAVIRKDHIFCGYPALTFRHLARVNAGPLYFNRFRSRTIAALWKYAQRCFRYISCDSTILDACGSILTIYRVLRPLHLSCFNATAS
ncbi:hypothetical protein SCLCIDRAFT_1210179 [Scleroderma citrinum Foug A]|uniref:Uncharacterized protein n=1 Tax=Scleroderma citrinum Foug A TaxID=1036808 RepID=A0A0C3ARG8_9AGAM|nr:hypothetical protein SCLCIDRAFT_1210179 [Scleroderma citrinum Foug A]